MRIWPLSIATSTGTSRSRSSRKPRDCRNASCHKRKRRRFRAVPTDRRASSEGRTMSHRRIRQFNTRDTYPDQKLDNDLCQAVVAGNTVYLRGQVGQNIDTAESVGIGDVAAQTEQAMANVAQLLKEAGAELEDVVKIVIYLVDPRYREPVYRVIGRWLKGVYPVSTGIVVTALARPEWLVEIDVTAVIPESG